MQWIPYVLYKWVRQIAIVFGEIPVISNIANKNDIVHVPGVFENRNANANRKFNVFLAKEFHCFVHLIFQTIYGF